MQMRAIPRVWYNLLSLKMYWMEVTHGIVYPLNKSVCPALILRRHLFGFILIQDNPFDGSQLSKLATLCMWKVLPVCASLEGGNSMCGLSLLSTLCESGINLRPLWRWLVLLHKASTNQSAIYLYQRLCSCCLVAFVPFFCFLLLNP